MDDITISFQIISNLFNRYTILINKYSEITSVYCQECGVWVASYEYEDLIQLSSEEFLYKIVKDHTHQVRGKPVIISDDSVESIL